MRAVIKMPRRRVVLIFSAVTRHAYAVYAAYCHLRQRARAAPTRDVVTVTLRLPLLPPAFVCRYADMARYGFALLKADMFRACRAAA